MTKPIPRAVAAPAPIRVAAAVTLTVILSLALLLAPHAGHAAAKDADVLGRWITDKAQPDKDYNVKAGPAGKIIVEVPAKAAGLLKDEIVTLDPVSPGAFATPKGQPVYASFTVKGPRRAEFKMMINRPDSFHVTDQLLERP